MSEEKMSLIEELQNPPYPEGGHLDDLIQSAAARIEQLEAALREIAIYNDNITKTIRELDQSSPPKASP
jgi:hypothetical protein